MLDVIFSEQNSNLMYSVEFSPDLVQIKVRETISGFFLTRMDLPIQVWHTVEMMRTDLEEHQMMQFPITENQLGTMQLMEEVTEHVGMNYPEIPDSRFVAQPVDDSLFPWEEEIGSVETPITIDEDEGFSETMTPKLHNNHCKPRPTLRSIENLQNSSAARQLFV